jgi:hypothetical protein
MNSRNKDNKGNSWAKDTCRLLMMQNWQGRTARTLLGADIVIWTLLLYFIIDCRYVFFPV